MTQQEAIFEYILRMGDNSLILGHRLSEWCGHGPILEQDIALTNIALDLIGQSRNYLTAAGNVEGKGRSEDDLAFFRIERDFKNVLLVEQPNGDWGVTLARQFLFDHFHYLVLQELRNSSHEELRDIAEKSIKEVTYHVRYSSDWMKRLGDGTEESHRRVQQGIDDLWRYTGEMFEMDEVDAMLIEAGIAPDLSHLKEKWHENVSAVLKEATIDVPGEQFMQTGGKKGIHTEHLGYLLAEMQHLPRTYPDAKW